MYLSHRFLITRSSWNSKLLSHLKNNLCITRWKFFFMCIGANAGSDPKGVQWHGHTFSFGLDCIVGTVARDCFKTKAGKNPSLVPSSPACHCHFPHCPGGRGSIRAVPVWSSWAAWVPGSARDPSGRMGTSPCPVAFIATAAIHSWAWPLHCLVGVGRNGSGASPTPGVVRERTSSRWGGREEDFSEQGRDEERILTCFGDLIKKSLKTPASCSVCTGEGEGLGAWVQPTLQCRLLLPHFPLQNSRSTSQHMY